MHLDLLFRFQIDPGSVSLVQMTERHAIVRLLNWIEIDGESAVRLSGFIH